MQQQSLGVVEKKVLGALLILANDNMTTFATNTRIAKTMGYKHAGGAITYALKVLEMQNMIIREDKGRYKVLL